MNKRPMKKYKIAVLDDYQNAALESADWSVLRDRADNAVLTLKNIQGDTEEDRCYGRRFYKHFDSRVELVDEGTGQRISRPRPLGNILTR